MAANRYYPDELRDMGSSRPLAGSAWETHLGLPLERRWLPEMSVRAGHVLFDGLGMKTFGDLLSLDVETVFAAKNSGVKTVKEIIALRDRVFALGPSYFTEKKDAEDASEITNLPLSEIEKLSARAQHFLARNKIKTYAQLFALTPKDILRCKGAGAKMVKELASFAKACGAEEKKPSEPPKEAIADPASFCSFAGFVLGAADAEAVSRIQGRWMTVLCDSLALGAGSEKRTLEEVGMSIGLTRERVRQIGRKIEKLLFGSGRTARYAQFAEQVVGIFEETGWVIRCDDLINRIDGQFGWSGTTLANIVALMGYFGHDVAFNTHGWCGLDLDAHAVELPVPLSIGALRRQTIIAVLREAGPQGLEQDEILSRCRNRAPGIGWTAGNIRGAANKGVDLDDCGTRMIGYDRGRKLGGRTRFSLNTFFHDDQTKSVLEQAANEVGAYMRSTGFGIVSVWKIWQKYRRELPLALPKLGFYMMMRDIRAGGLEYRDYPRISLPGIDVCDNAYWWEFYQYFRYCGKSEAMFGQIMSFFVDCLGLQPSIAEACAFQSMGLKKVEDELTAPYVLKRPPKPEKTPRVLLGSVKRAPELSLIKSSDKFTIHSDYFDDDGRALNHTTYVRGFMRELEKGKFMFPPNELAMLLDKGWCKTNLKTYRAMLAQFPDYPPRGSGYWKERFTFGGEVYFVNEDWEQRNKPFFDRWATRIARMAGIEFEPYDVIGMSNEE